MMMEVSSELKFTLLGISVHALYLFSVFHIYFKSPILQGLPSVSVPYEATAKRLVLISADGLQAEKAFHRKYAARTSFFRSILMHNGSWGVSHTRVPTETRVGHVSIFAGTYEDVSAITNGWKNNPVEFDSVINRSSTTWYWGDKGIISIFDHHSKNIKSHAYGTDELDLDFADKDTTRLDKWVFDKVEEFFQKAKSVETLNRQLHEDKLVFFLHLNGIDTIGHAMKPDSTESLDNVAFVDTGIRNITKAFDSFYDHDGMTTYIVTSDHGMTPWGSHGAGEPLETETPFIAWGAGIKKAKYKRNINNGLQSTVWGLEDYERHDMEQVDLAPLMAFLLGCSIPVNSVGRLPFQVIDVSAHKKATGLLLNVKQIKEQYNAHEQKVIDTAFIFRSYSGIQDFQGEKMIENITSLINNNHYLLAIHECNRYISSALKGIKYYQNYDTYYLCFVVNISFLTWMLIVILKVVRNHTPLLSSGRTSQGYLSPVLQSKIFTCVYYCTVIACCMFLWYCSRNYVFVLFSLFPMMMLRCFLNELSVLNMRRSVNKKELCTFAAQLLLIIFGVEMIVLSFFRRGTLSIVGIFLSALPWIKVLSASTVTLTAKKKCICVAWSISTLVICVFLQFPVVTREEHYFLVLLAGFIGTTVCLIYSFLVKNSNVIAAQTGLMFFSIVVKMHTVLNIDNGGGLPIANQVFSWLTLIVLPAVAFLVDATSIERLMSMSMSLFSVYILTAISYEPLFLLNLILILLVWVFMELSVFDDDTRKNPNMQTERYLTSDHLRISFIFLYFIFLSFFGTGNVASVNSFDAASTYCFQTIYNKVIQGIIIIIKAFIPFGTVTLFFRSLQSIVNIPMRGLFLIVLLMTDLMAVNFFFLIKDEGSWLDIGESVCHFLVTILFIMVLVPIYELSYYISGNVTLSERKPHSL